jgi:hypothetical protein
MAQHDYSIANQTAPSLRTDLNNSLSAIVSQNSGTTAPSTTYANMFWYDTTNDILKMRNETNTAWIELFDLDQGSNLASPSNIASQAEAEAGTNTSKMMTPQRVSQAIDALAPQVLEGWHPYDMVTAGDGADGIIWTGGVDANITNASGKETPNFEDGYDYAILFNQVGVPSVFTNVYLVLDFYGATTASYFESYTHDQSIVLRSDDYWFEFVTPTRFVLEYHSGLFVGPGTNGVVVKRSTTAQKIGKMRIRVSTSASAGINTGTIRLYRRRNYITG